MKQGIDRVGFQISYIKKLLVFFKAFLSSGIESEDAGLLVPEKYLLQARHEYKQGSYKRGLQFSEQAILSILDMEDKSQTFGSKY